MFAELVVDATERQADRRLTGPYRRDVPITYAGEVTLEIKFKFSCHCHIRRRIKPFEIHAESRGSGLDVEFRGCISTDISNKSGQRKVVAVRRRAVVKEGGFQEPIRLQREVAELESCLEAFALRWIHGEYAERCERWNHGWRG